MTSSPLRQFLCCVLATVLTGIGNAQTPDSAALARKQEDQERARGMTRSLLDGVLELQRRQLEENGLTDLPVYRDIGLMRKHLQEIVDEEMARVVELLVTAQTAGPRERDAAFIEARQMIRTVVVRLSAERQSLLRRLKAAELTEQIDRLLVLQGEVQAQVRNSQEQAQPKQAELLLKALEDQRDVRELFLHLVDTLDDVRTWGGTISETAVDGLRLLKAADVGRHLDDVELELAKPQAEVALSHQTLVLNGLNDLLRLLQKNRGLLEPQRNEALEKLQALVQQQEQIRTRSKALADDAVAAAELVEEQVKLQQQLAELKAALPDSPAADKLTDQAEAAAKTAAEDLFEMRNAAAVERQTEVLANLAALNDLLSRSSREVLADQSAAELAQQVAQLKSTQADLEKVAKQQQEVDRIAGSEGKQAAEQEAEVAADLEQIRNALPQTDNVAIAIEEAQAAAAAAARALEKASNTPAEDNAPAAESREMLQAADTALEQALANVGAELDTLERRADAVKIGELARAAEVLERAAAEEREVAAELSAAMKLPAVITPEAVADLASRQQEVAAIADKVAQGLEQTAPTTAAAVEKARQQADDGRKSLETAQAAGDPQARSASLQQARTAASQSADQLSQAASALRKEIAESARQLAERSGQRANELAEARQQVEETLDSPTNSLAEQMAQLEQARALAQRAAAEQQRAAGRPQAAAAMELARAIEEAQAAQDLAVEAAEQFERGESATPLKATTAQQTVADLAAELKEQLQTARQSAGMKPESLKAADAASATLQAAAETATEAARAMLNGKPEQAAAARRQTQAKLEDAARQARELAAQARKAPASEQRNAEAQQRSAEAAQQAASLAKDPAPQAARSLEAAAAAGNAAARQLSEPKSADTQDSQDRASEALAAAEQELQQALRDLATKQAEALAAQAAHAADLAKATSRLDLPASSALKSAREAAESGARATDSPARQAKSVRSARQQLERSAAALSSREQELLRDQAVAGALSDLAQQQQQAAATLADQRSAMQAAGDEGTSPAVDPQQAEMAARQFADAQTATGQGAVELSGQEQIANSQLREALEMAGELLKTFPGQTLAAAGTTSVDRADGADGADDAPLMPAESSGPMPTGEPPEAGMPTAAESSAAGSANSRAQAGSQPGNLPPGQSPPDTGFVPKNPQLTAQMMAGKQLADAMQNARQNSSNSSQQQMAGAQNSPATAGDQQLETNSSAQSGQQATRNDGSRMQAARQSSGETENQGLKDGALQDEPEGTEIGETKGAGRQGDAELTARQYQDQAWFAKLPPELRKSLRAGNQQQAPKAYQERLRRYFQSVD